MIGNLEFKGIVRATSAQNNSDGNCEEIINMRFNAGTWNVVGKKRVLLEDMKYENVYVHKYSGFENYIGIKNGKVIWFAALVDDSVIYKDQEICSVTGDISLNQINNILLVRDDSSILKAIFVDNSYKSIFVDLVDAPVVTFNFEKFESTSAGGTELGFHSVIGPYDYKSSDGYKAFQDSLAAALNAYKASRPNYEEGRVLVCTSYTLFDGSETKISPCYCIELGGDSYKSDIVHLLQFENNDYFIEEKNDLGEVTKVKFCIELSDLNLYKLYLTPGKIDDKYKDIVSKVNVYVSAPFSFYDINDVVVPFDALHVSVVFKERKLSYSDVEKVLFYKVASWSRDDYSSIPVDFEKLTTYNRMPVDVSGWIRTTGKMFVYNNRLHLFCTKNSFVESRILGYSYSFADMNLLPSGYDPRSTTVFVYLKINGKDVITKYDFRGAYVDGKLRLPKVLTFPDSRAYKMVFCDGSGKSFSAELTDMQSYNISYCVLEDVFVEMVTTDSPVVSNFWEDNTNLIVSSLNNPYYFPPEYSYLMPGEIINLAISADQISQSQIGQYPLYVFTTEGIYALQSGSGNVLYSNVIPISMEVAVKESNVFQTRNGIIFVTDAGLKLISGQSVVNLSEPLNGLPDTSIRKSKQYMRAVTHARTFDISAEVSQVDFRKYIRKAVIGYDITHDELIVSNSEYKYSYVYSFENKMWHKITQVFYSFQLNFGVDKHVKIIPAKGAVMRFTFTGIPVAGDKIGMKIGNDIFEYVVEENDSLIKVCVHLMNSIQLVYPVIRMNNMLFVTLAAGANSNAVQISTINSDSVRITHSVVSSGKDSYNTDVLDLCDIRLEDDSVLPICIQTRPINLDSFGFKRILHTALRGELKALSEDKMKYYGCYVFASNDLSNWECVSEKIFASHLIYAVLSRIMHSFRYFIVLTGGYVEPGHSVAVFEIEGDAKYENRLR